MTSELGLHTLRRSPASELERLYAKSPPVYLGTGCFRAHDLGATPAYRGSGPLVRAMISSFWCVPWGVDLTRRCWFVATPRLALGAFELQPGPSRWRETETYRMHYDRSRLPRPLRNILYDELKPLTESLCLGLAGLNAERDRGDLRYFALERLDNKDTEIL